MGLYSLGAARAGINGLADRPAIDTIADANDHANHLQHLRMSVNQPFCIICLLAARRDGSRERWRLPAENVFNSKVKDPRDAEGAFQGRRIFSQLYGNHRLPGDADGFSQSCLTHRAMRFAQLPDTVGDGRCFRHGSDTPAIEEYLEHILENLGQHQAEEDQVEQHVPIHTDRVMP